MPGTAGLHITALIEKEENVWKGCRNGSKGHSFLDTLGILEHSNLGNQFIPFNLRMETEFPWNCQLEKGITVLMNFLLNINISEEVNQNQTSSIRITCHMVHTVNLGKMTAFKFIWLFRNVSGVPAVCTAFGLMINVRGEYLTSKGCHCHSEDATELVTVSGSSG